MIRVSLFLVGLLFLLTLPASASWANPTSPRFGLWIEAEGTHQPWISAESFEQVQKMVESGKFTDLYCQVYRDGKSWFPSMVADDTPYREALKRGLDPLRKTIDMAHARGIRVHAWINSLRIIKNRNAPLLKVIGPDAVLVDGFGNSLLTYDRDGRPPGRLKKLFGLGTPGYWLDAANPRVREYLLATVEDVVRAYPDLDGVHLDMIRFPLAMKFTKNPRYRRLADFGYSENSIKAFRKFTGQNLKSQNIPSGDQWKQWRSAQVTLVVIQIRELMNRISSTMQLSIAGIADVKKANIVFQNWPIWIDSGMLDHVVVMNYGRNSKRVDHVSHQARISSKDHELYVGLGAWLLLKKPYALAEQARSALNHGANGVVLFSYSNLLSRNGLGAIQQTRSVVLQ